ncbi:MAG: ParB N-terminal domain-containing protein [Alkalinema sp. RU_4_3]|nr:ParB N-terminal domain-containing protein [Alkalinema sp. RU_4_3]NJR70442.1 ParB N-terminal domain-containing protein [Synechococcales cyanobacterium CRU_2_2]
MKGLRNLKSTSVKPSIDTPQSSRLTLAQITDRPGGDTRPLNPSHIEALAESIAAVGLIQPIAVDSQGRLLAGGHRRAAIVHLQATNPTAFSQWFGGGVPVHRFDFDAAADEVRALAIEASENEKRRDYTPGEVRLLADRLRQSGYSDLKGRPKPGQKSVVLALSTIIGKSDKTVRRYLIGDESPKGGQVSSFSESATATARSLTKLMACDDCPDDVRKAAAKLAKLLSE